MIKTNEIWCVEFNPIENQFDIGTLESIIQGNLESILLYRKETETEKSEWFIIFVCKSMKECQDFIKKHSEDFKTDFSSFEKWLIENNYKII